MHAKTIRELLKTTAITEDFFTGLDAFNLNYIDMCFKKALDDQMGMMGEVEYHNYQLFMRHKEQYGEDFYPEIRNHKKAS